MPKSVTVLPMPGGETITAQPLRCLPMTIAYGPSATQTWLRCPRAFAYDRAGWYPRTVLKSDASALIGQAMHAGLAAIHSGKDAVAAREAWQSTLQQGEAKWRTAGRIPLADASVIPTLYRGAGDRALDAYAADPFVCTPLQIETPLGRARPDMITDEPAVVDWKIRLDAWRDPRWQAGYFAAFHRSWQVKDYLWRASEALGRPVRRFYAVILVLTPKYQRFVEQVDVPDDTLARWHPEAERVWSLMDGPTWPNETRCDNWGYNAPCVWYDACWLYEQDPVKMGLTYGRTPDAR